MLVTLGARSASCHVSPADENPLSPLVVSMVTQQAIAPVLGSDDRYHLLYELQLTNALGSPADLRSVTVLEAENGKTLLTLNAAEIIKGDYLDTLDRQLATSTMFAPFEGRVLILNLSIESGGEHSLVTSPTDLRSPARTRSTTSPRSSTMVAGR